MCLVRGIVRQVVLIHHRIFQQCLQPAGVVELFQLLGGNDVGCGETDGIRQGVFIEQVIAFLSDLLYTVPVNGFLADEVLFAHQNAEDGILGLDNHCRIPDAVFVVCLVEVEIGERCVVNGGIDGTAVVVLSPDAVYRVSDVVFVGDAIERVIVCGNLVGQRLDLIRVNNVHVFPGHVGVAQIDRQTGGNAERQRRHQQELERLAGFPGALPVQIQHKGEQHTDAVQNGCDLLHSRAAVGQDTQPQCRCKQQQRGFQQYLTGTELPPEKAAQEEQQGQQGNVCFRIEIHGAVHQIQQQRADQNHAEYAGEKPGRSSGKAEHGADCKDAARSHADGKGTVGQIAQVDTREQDAPERL